MLHDSSVTLYQREPGAGSTPLPRRYVRPARDDDLEAMFIHSPYEPCPKCGSPASLGLALVAEMSYFKRCSSCLYELQRQIPPPPEPAVLLLDQWTLSALAKALLPETRERFADPDDKRRQQGFWPRAYARIERLVKCGLLVCPPSQLHREESSKIPTLEAALQRLHLHLSGDAYLEDSGQVVIWQLHAAFVGFLDGVEPRLPDRSNVLELPRRWPQPIGVHLDLRLRQEEIDALEARREWIDDNLSKIVPEWEAQRGRSFEDRRDEQLRSFGKGYENAGGDFYSLTRNALTQRAVPVEEWIPTLQRFLASNAASAVPAAQLRAGLMAGVGLLAESHQLGEISGSVAWDMQSISAYGPYVDAAFVDRQFQRLIDDTPLGSALPVDLRVYSVKDLDAFEVWLDEVEAAAPQGHFDRITEIYGAQWLEPYRTLLER
jgi:hypothetical protein